MAAQQSWASNAGTRKSMQGNRSRDTSPELALRRALHAGGLRYRVCARPERDLRRTADIVFRKAHVAVEVRGCFWHGCPDHYRAPKSHGSYWSDKVRHNRERDAAMDAELARRGWNVIVVWEHEDLAESVGRVKAALGR
jgi:DNA mismatch endonuclease (patch repair protein)